MVDLASISTGITDWVAHNGVYAVFVLMAIDALLPAGGELIMLYAGVLASGSVSGHHVMLFGISLPSGVESYVILALAGTLGYLLGSLIGWAIGRCGGRALIERHGRWLHLNPETFARAERWFDRYGPRAVLFGRITPLVRSFISIPAGVFRSPLPTYVPLTLLGSAVWCSGSPRWDGHWVEAGKPSTKTSVTPTTRWRRPSCSSSVFSGFVTFVPAVPPTRDRCWPKSLRTDLPGFARLTR